MSEGSGGSYLNDFADVLPLVATRRVGARIGALVIPHFSVGQFGMLRQNPLRSEPTELPAASRASRR